MSSDIARITLAAWLANHKDLGFNDPCWLVLIAPSSTAKTVIIAALSDATRGYILDTLTPNTWLSGLKLGKRKGFSLLKKLGKFPNVVVKDLSVILTKRPYDREEILGQLRAIYDGEYSRPTGRTEGDQEARWKGRMKLMVGMTPIIDLFHTLGNQLGERFIQLRFAISEKYVVAVAGQALLHEEQELRPRQELAEVFRCAIEEATPYLSKSVLTDELKVRLTNLVAFVVKARTGVPRHGGDVVMEPTPEGPGRLVKQLAALACGLTALSGRRSLSERDYRRLERVAFNTIPQPRAKIIWKLYDHGVTRLTEFEGLLNVSKPTVRRHLDDLVRLHLATRRNPEPGRRTTYRPSALGRRYLDAARGEGAPDGT